MSAELVTGDTGSVLRVPCSDNESGEPIPLAGASDIASLAGSEWRLGGAGDDHEDDTAGIASYQFAEDSGGSRYCRSPR